MIELLILLFAMLGLWGAVIEEQNYIRNIKLIVRVYDEIPPHSNLDDELLLAWGCDAKFVRKFRQRKWI